MRNKTPWLSLLCLLFITGCARFAAYDPTAFAQGESAVVVLRSRMIHHMKDSDNAQTIALDDVWKKKDGTFGFSSFTTSDALAGGDGEEFKAVMISPGLYYLNSFFWDIKSNYPYSDERIYYSIEPERVLFTVRAGDVVYLGDLNVEKEVDGIFFPKLTMKGIYLNDTFADAQKFLQTKHPELAPRLKKQLMILKAAFDLPPQLAGAQ